MINQYKTSKGHSIAWLNRCTYQMQGYDGYSGRVRVVVDDPSKDEVVKWDSNMQPINHDYGQIQRVTGAKNASVNGFNIFSGLVKQQSMKQR